MEPEESVVTYLAYEAERALQKPAEAYLMRFLGHPDRDSEFYRSIGVARYLFRMPFLRRGAMTIGKKYLKRRGYDALMARQDDEIIGFLAFQIHDDNTLHTFSTYVDERHRGRGLAREMHEELIEISRAKGIEKMRFGAGGHELGGRIHQNFSEREDELGIEAQEEFWIKILYE